MSTNIVVILDKSWSMETMLDKAIAGFNEFLKEQQKTADIGDTLTLVAFSSYYGFGGSYYDGAGDKWYEVLYDNQDIKKVEPLTKEKYIPDGCTALNDAIGKTLSKVTKQYCNIKKDLIPQKTIVVIITDGYENSSKEFNHAQVVSMIKGNTEAKELPWDFIYIGAELSEHSTLSAAGSLGINVSTGMNYKGRDIGKTFQDVAKYAKARKANTVCMASVGTSIDNFVEPVV